MGLDITGIGAIADLATTVVNKFWPDKTEEEKAQLAAQLTVIQGQLDANKAEATNTNWFVSGWRPGVGWVCVAALAMCYIPKALVLTIIWTWQCIVLLSAWHGSGALALPAYPDLGITDLIGLLMSMLGLGGMRMVEKLNGVAAK